jgi:hypothetical protein
MGSYYELQTINRKETKDYGQNVYSYVRWADNEKLIISCNLSAAGSTAFELKIPADIIRRWNLKDGEYDVKDQIYGKMATRLIVKNGEGKVWVKLGPSDSVIYKL